MSKTTTTRKGASRATSGELTVSAISPNDSREWGDERYIIAKIGIPRTPLRTLRKHGKIRTVSLKLPGAKYGKRLYHIPSIVAFIEMQEAREKRQLKKEGASA